MNTTTLKKLDQSTSLQSYSVLRRKVEEALSFAQMKIDAAKIEGYWNAGAYINEHVRLNGGRAEYGDRTCEKLAGEMGLGKRVLWRLSQFHEKFSDFKIVSTLTQLPSNHHKIEKNDRTKPLTWSHFCFLITIEDDSQRHRLSHKTWEGGWTVERLEEEIYKLKERSKRRLLETPDNQKSRGKSNRNLLEPKLGKINTYRLVAPSKIHWPAEDGLMFDRGFKSYTYLPAAEVKNFRDGEIVETRDGKIVKSDRTAKDLFTYLAYLDYVIDGDSVPRKAAQEMRAGPSKPICRNGLQSTLSGFG